MSEPITLAARSPHMDLPFLFPAQAQKEATVNEALARIDALLAPCVEGESATPPASPNDGSCWIVAADPQADWAGRAGDLAFHTGGTWHFSRARPGMPVYDDEAGHYRRWIDGWQALALPDVPTTGATIDSEARSAIAALVAGLRIAGIGI